MRVLILIEKLGEEIRKVEVFGSITSLNEQFPKIAKSTLQQNLVKNGVYKKDGIMIFRRNLSRKKRLTSVK